MGVDLSRAKAQAVGIGLHDGEFAIRVVRNTRRLVALGGSVETPSQIDGVPIVYADCYQDVTAMVRLPASGPGSPGAASLVPEQSRHRPLVCGLQVQNYDDDDRQGNLTQNIITIGTLGCFVELAGGDTAILSNNHVLAGENDGQTTIDRILQPGTASPGDIPNQQIATLTDFVALQTSPAGATPAMGTVNFNVLDAAVATLDDTIQFNQGFLPSRTPPATISGHAAAAAGVRVYKVGRTTGLTFGEVTMSSVVVGPIAYRPGACWFQNSIEIEGGHGAMFSDSGDSGSAIVHATTGEVVGLLYAGNGTQTYACPNGDALSHFNCTLS